MKPCLACVLPRMAHGSLAQLRWEGQPKAGDTALPIFRQSDFDILSLLTCDIAVSSSTHSLEFCLLWPCTDS